MNKSKEEFASWIQHIIENNNSQTATIIILEELASDSPVPDKVDAKQWLEKEGYPLLMTMTRELFETLESLCDMWNQYCGDKWGHMFMSAGENCADVLDKYKLLKNDKGTGGEVDWDRLEELRKTIE